MNSKIGKSAGAILVVGAGILLFTYSPPEPEQPPPPVRPAKVMKLETPDAAAARRYTGRVQATARVDLSFRVSGPLIELPVVAFDKVRKGDLVARIDPRDFQTRVDQISADLDERRAKLEAMKVGARPEDIAILEAQVRSAKARFNRAMEDFKRDQQLVKTGAGTQADLDRAEAVLEVTRERVAEAEESLTKGKAGARKEDITAQEAAIKGIEASLRAARDALGDTSLRAPYDGQIARRYVENFEDVRAKQRIVSLQDVSGVEIVTDFPASVVAMLLQDQIKKVTASFDFARDRAFEVTFREAEIEADRRTQTYAVTFVMPTPEDVRILPGMSGTVRLYLKRDSELPTRWLVPSAAVLTHGGRTHAWRVDPATMTVTRVEVEVGDLQDDRIWVVKGLKPGDTIVTAGVRLLREGMKIRSMETTTG